MIQLFKCLGHSNIFGIIYLLTLTLSECKPDFGLNNVLEANKDTSGEIADDLIEQLGPSTEKSEQSENDKRDWTKFNSWGKRYINVLYPWEKRKWQSFNSWGKRSDVSDENLSRNLAQRSGNGEWSSFSTWGKREDNDIDHSNGLDKKSKEQFQGPLNVDKRKWSEFNSWGKRESDDVETPLEADKREWSQFTSWGKRADENEVDKRKWSEFNSWGKRDDEIPGAVKRKWKSFNSWGKRDDAESDLPSDKRNNWSKFTSWGKRDINEGTDLDKREWASFNSWGKRGDKWSTFVPWGKRGDEWSTFVPWGKRGDKWSTFVPWGKRGDKWSTFVPWGKRDNSDLDTEKRKWKQFASWGKREDSQEIDPSKREWSGFTSWGKRDGGADTADIESGLTTDKRGWSQFSSWRKRLRNARNRNWNMMGNWGKRRWAGLVTWGKRSGAPATISVDSVVSKLLHFFDKNGDDSLDKEELRDYIHKLMSVPAPCLQKKRNEPGSGKTYLKAFETARFQDPPVPKQRLAYTDAALLWLLQFTKKLLENNMDPDQTVRMHRLVWIQVVLKCHKGHFSRSWLK